VEEVLRVAKVGSFGLQRLLDLSTFGLSGKTGDCKKIHGTLCESE
jgi:hypothetical protein